MYACRVLSTSSFNKRDLKPKRSDRVVDVTGHISDMWVEGGDGGRRVACGWEDVGLAKSGLPATSVASTTGPGDSI